MIDTKVYRKDANDFCDKTGAPVFVNSQGHDVFDLLDEIDRLNAELAQLKEADRWIPVFDGETLVGFQHDDDFNLLPPAPDLEAK